MLSRCLIITVGRDALRLAGGSTDVEGRVEVYQNSVWESVCVDYATDNLASDVCRVLGEF